jgi:hypothetical protein
MSDLQQSNLNDGESSQSDNAVILGHKLPRAKPIMLTFYDRLQDYPYTTTFYVREETSQEQSESLIKAVSDLSICILGKYKIGYQDFIVPDYRDKLKRITPYAMGTFKWLIKFYVTTYFGDLMARSVTIPGRDIDTSIGVTHGVNYGLKGNAAKRPDPKHPKWITFVQIFTAICVSKEGMIMNNYVDLDITSSNWPPKGAKKRR